ncbi:MAG: ribosomal protein S18-alanine N-acetyltransferase [Azoarcus sp.]|jgi:ribosomal-protein-alanine N-acetyltransferase|nr:ribosomal protein S18-alanine N-acetyltransferase [Azoarcus sp.]
MTADKCRFVPMTESDLDWVTAQEACLHASPWTRQNFVDSLDSDYFCPLMYEGALPVAYAVVFMVLDEAHLLNLSVVRGEQGRGLGRRLLEFLMDKIRHDGCLWFFLEVRPSNTRALALYQRTGFVEIGRRASYYPSPDGREDAIVMRCGL